MSSKRIGPFLGINTSLPPTQLEKFERGERAGSFMRALDNVDVTDTGTLRTREGWKQKLGGLAVRGLYGLADGTALVADKTYLITGDLEAVREVAPFGAAFDSWCKGPDGQLYWFSDRGLAKASEDCVVQALPWWFSVF